MNTWDWYVAAREHLRSHPRKPGDATKRRDPSDVVLLAVAMYWARAKGTDWQTGKNTSHSQREASDLLGLHHNTVGKAQRFWIERGYMRLVERRFDSSLVVDLVLPAAEPVGFIPPPPRPSDFPDSESFADAAERYLAKREAA